MKKLHAKDKGTLGEIAVAKYLMERGLPVFKELGDNSQVDLIALYKKRAIKIQVKSYKRYAEKSTVLVTAKKAGPNGYRFTYAAEDFDVFAIYLYEVDKILFVPLNEVLKQKSKQFTLRLTKPKNNQTKGIRLASDYRSFSRAVKRL